MSFPVSFTWSSSSLYSVYFILQYALHEQNHNLHYWPIAKAAKAIISAMMPVASPKDGLRMGQGNGLWIYDMHVWFSRFCLPFQLLKELIHPIKGGWHTSLLSTYNLKFLIQLHKTLCRNCDTWGMTFGLSHRITTTLTLRSKPLEVVKLSLWTSLLLISSNPRLLVTHTQI